MNTLTSEFSFDQKHRRTKMNIHNWLLVLPLLLLSNNLVDASGKIVGIGIAKNDHVYVWFTDGKVTSGTSEHFEKYRHAYSYSLPPGKRVSDIVAISIAGSNDHVYAWYKDGTVSSGTTDDLDKYRAPYSYTLPPGKTVNDIVAIGIAGSNDHVYAWYKDGKVSSGTTDDLDKHRAPYNYSLPSGKTAEDIVEIDIAKSNDRVYVWYRNGTGSSGTSSDLDSQRASYGYVPGQVIYRWWGPASLNLRPRPVAFSEAFAYEKEKSSKAIRYQGVTDEPGRVTTTRPELEPTDYESVLLSPNWSEPRLTSQTGGALDPMIAVGNQYLITSDTSNIAFYDKQGNLLPEKNAMPTKMGTSKFFEGFVAETNADGSFNESNINLYLGFPKPCDSPDYPQTTSGKRFCIASFYDTRVFFDSTSNRFFIISNSRHPLWEDPTQKFGECSYYNVPLSSVSNTRTCKKIKDNTCTLSSSAYCDLPRRYVAFAVSKTEDPRDGFHQYMITENNFRDWPWMAVNGNAFIVTHKGASEADAAAPVATVFSVNAVKSGDQHPPYFRYYSQDVGELKAVLPPAHYKNAAGLSFLLGSAEKRVDIFAFPQPSDPWTAPPLLKTSVNLSEKASIFNAVYRAGKLYLIANKLVEEDGEAKRYSVRLVRIPIEQPSASSIQASTASAKGFLDWFFGRNAPGDSSGSRISYEQPALAVNKNGDVLFAYGRYPFSPQNSLKPEARYTVWYANEAKQRRSRLLREGTAANSETINSALDYTTAVVDPSDDATFWMALPFADGNGYKTVIGKVTP
jgi:hypothetical protein